MRQPGGVPLSFFAIVDLVMTRRAWCVVASGGGPVVRPAAAHLASLIYRHQVKPLRRALAPATVTEIRIFAAAAPYFLKLADCHFLAIAAAALGAATFHGTAPCDHFSAAVAFEQPQRNSVSIGAGVANRDQSVKPLAGQILECKHSRATHFPPRSAPDDPPRRSSRHQAFAPGLW